MKLQLVRPSCASRQERYDQRLGGLLLDMLVDIAGPNSRVIPSAGPAYGTMMDQANMLRAMRRGDWSQAEHVQHQFQPRENLRNRIHPVRVLRRAVALAGIAETGPLLPLRSDVEPEHEAEIQHAARELLALNGRKID